jgi:hypothetical protein
LRYFRETWEPHLGERFSIEIDLAGSGKEDREVKMNETITYSVERLEPLDSDHTISRWKERYILTGYTEREAVAVFENSKTLKCYSYRLKERLSCNTILERR